MPGLLVGVAFATSVALTWWMRGIGRTGGLLDSAGAPGHAKALRAVPNIGGDALTAALLLPLAALLVWARLAARDGTIGAALAAAAPALAAVGGGAAALHVVGLVDDRRSIEPAPKLALMLAIAGLTAWSADLRLLTLLDDAAGGTWASIALTILWIAVVTNAMNFLDNMDGAAAGVTVVAAGALFAIAAPSGQWSIAVVLALLIGAAAGFLVFNRPPATIFMGDGGSLVIGFMLGVLSVAVTYVDLDDPAAGRWHGVLVPLAVLAVPLYDFLSVIVMRLAQGRSPFVGDQQHFSHRLRRRGLSVRRTLAVMLGCSAITGIAGVVLARVDGAGAVLLGCQVVLTLAVLAIYEHGSSAAAVAGRSGS